MLSRATDLRRGTVAAAVKAVDAPERQDHDIGRTQYQRIQLNQVVKQVVQHAAELRQKFTQAARDMAREIPWMRPRQLPTPSQERQREAPEISRGMSFGR